MALRAKERTRRSAESRLVFTTINKGGAMSKGSKPRPMNRDKFNENFDKIFGKKKEKTDENKNNNRK